MHSIPKEYQVIIMNPNRCVNYETCMEICTLVHESKYFPLTKRIIGMRVRIEMEWVISCDLCSEMKDEFIDRELGRKPQCVDMCPNNAIFIGALESYGNESRSEAINRIFKKPN
jgi:Fe-S-cluster-containing dehydrogenase component